MSTRPDENHLERKSRRAKARARRGRPRGRRLWGESLEVRNLLANVAYSPDSVWAGDTFTAYGISIVDDVLSWDSIQYHDGRSATNQAGDQEGEPVGPAPAPSSPSLPSQPPLVFSPLPGGATEQFVAHSLAYEAIVGPDGVSLSWSGGADLVGLADLRIDMVDADAAARWIESMPSDGGGFPTVAYDDVYAGIDLVYYGAGQQLEFDFIVEPGANPELISLQYVGLDNLHVNAGGHLVLDGPGGELWQYPLVVYQETGGERAVIDSSYRVDGDTVRFDLGDYDPARPLIIDPVVGGPDPGVQGPLAVTTRNFDLGEEVFVPPDFAAAWAANPPAGPGAPATAPGVEMRGAVYYPTNLDGPHPLVIFMHGRHATTFNPQTGVPFLEWPVPAGRQEIPSYEGYAFIGQLLASHGYIVASIGANGINANDQDRFPADTTAVTDGGMQARAELFIEHLQMWQTCNTAAGCTAFGTDFTGHVDLNNVGLMGHSRGGEGVARAVVHNENLGSPFGINAAFLLAPTNFNRDLVDNVPFTVVLPYADGDVIDLQGVHYFDDSQFNVASDPEPMFYHHIMGANHNYYNTVWTPNNGYPANDDGAIFQGLPRLTPAEQRGTAEAYLTGFFRRYLGGEVDFDGMLKGDFFPPPSAMTQEIYATYHAPENPTSQLNLNRYFDNNDLTTNDVGGAVRRNPVSPLTPYTLCGGQAPQPPFCVRNQSSPNEPHTTQSAFSNRRGLSQLHLGWNDAEAYLAQDIPVGQRDVSLYDAFQVRVSVDYSDTRNALGVAQDFTIRLVDGNGNRADAVVSNHTNALFFPPGLAGDPRGANFPIPRVTLNTVRIPMSAFSGINLRDVASVEFLFNQQPTGALFLSDLAFVDPSSGQQPPVGGAVNIQGQKYRDDNGNGLRDPGEPGIAGIYIYVDLDSNGMISVGDPATVTGEFGGYRLPALAAGTYTVRELLTPGYAPTQPPNGLYSVTVTSNGEIMVDGQTVTSLNFGNVPAFDYADAPAPYRSLSVHNGPVHGILSGFRLGASVDADNDGFQDPNDLAASDDSSGTDDEDGVTFISLMAPGSRSEVEVVVATGNTSAGSLNAWIDFNQDGDFADAGERIVTNRFVGTGVHRLSFDVPLNALPGATWSRFRLSHQAGLSPVGPALDGEVEDHPVSVLDDDALAIDDNFSVFLNSENNRLDVLANDLPGINAYGTPVRLLAPLGPTDKGGTVTIDNGGTLRDFTDDVVLYTPAGGFLGTETFTYTMLDEDGNVDQATVTIQVQFPPDPIAVDDHFRVDRDAVGRILDVLANDLLGDNGPITIVNVSGASHGTVNLIDGGGRLSYTPASGYQGSDQFVYTVRDTVGATSSATVTLDVGDSSFDDLVRFQFVPTDMNGIPLANNEVPLGQQFKIRVFVEDIRDVTNNNPPLPVNMGVFSAYLDMLYTSRLVSLTDIAFGSVYTAARTGNAGVPGIVNELGAFQGGSTGVTTPVGPDPQLLAELTFAASHVGIARFDGDPADILPLHETLLHKDAANLTEALEVSYEQMQFVPATVRVTPAADLVGVILRTTDLAGQVIDSVEVGETFKLQVLADDLRSPALDRGVYSFYTDVVFDADRVEYDGQGNDPVLSAISFSDDFGLARNVILRDGELDEAGAILAGTDPMPVGPDPVVVFEVLFSATQAGDLTFRGNPADDGALHDIVLLRPGSGVTVPPSMVDYGEVTIGVTPPEPEFDFTNPLNPLDVNDDRLVTPVDALLLVNAINSGGPRLLTAADGEDPMRAVRKYPDVDNNGSLEPNDILRVINYLNSLSNVSGEGEADATLSGSDAALLLRPVADSRIETPVDAETGSPESQQSAVARVVDAVMSDGLTLHRFVADDIDSEGPTDDQDDPSLESLLDDMLGS